MNIFGTLCFDRGCRDWAPNTPKICVLRLHLSLKIFEGEPPSKFQLIGISYHIQKV